MQCEWCGQMLAVPTKLEPNRDGIQKLRCGKCLKVSKFAVQPSATGGPPSLQPLATAATASSATMPSSSSTSSATGPSTAGAVYDDGHMNSEGQQALSQQHQQQQQQPQQHQLQHQYPTSGSSGGYGVPRQSLWNPGQGQGAGAGAHGGMGGEHYGAGYGMQEGEVYGRSSMQGGGSYNEAAPGGSGQEAYAQGPVGAFGAQAGTVSGQFEGPGQAAGYAYDQSMGHNNNGAYGGVMVAGQDGGGQWGSYDSLGPYGHAAYGQGQSGYGSMAVGGQPMQQQQQQHQWHQQQQSTMMAGQPQQYTSVQQLPPHGQPGMHAPYGVPQYSQPQQQLGKQGGLSRSSSARPAPGPSTAAGQPQVPGLSRSASRSSTPAAPTGYEESGMGAGGGGIGPGGGLQRAGSTARRGAYVDRPGPAGPAGPAMRRMGSERVTQGTRGVSFEGYGPPERDRDRERERDAGAPSANAFRRVMTERIRPDGEAAGGEPGMQRSMTSGGGSYRRRVFVNGSAIPDALVDAVEERIGTIKPGRYW